MSERYFLSQPLTAGLVELDGTEAHHLGRVMRARPGDQVILFDGQGCEALATILGVSLAVCFLLWRLGGRICFTFVGRGLDMPLLRGVEWLEESTPIYVSDLEEWERLAGITVSSGDVLLVRGGRWAKRAKEGPWSYGRTGAGLHSSVLPWLKERGVSLLVGDAVNDVQPSGVRGIGRPIHTMTQVFIGTRFQCNQCHDHPFERWTQRQYYELSAYFAGVGRKAGPVKGEEIIYSLRTATEIKHPTTGETITAAFPFSSDLDNKNTDPRNRLANWLTISEEHTSELQSQAYLVCRLLLET